jgi:hypothetical protein
MARGSFLLAVLLLVGAGPAMAGPKVAVMPLDLVDQTAESALTGDPLLVLAKPKASPVEVERLARSGEELKRLLAERLGYEVVDLSPLAGEISQAAPFHKCDGCEADIARKAGAELVVSGNIQKITLMILNLNVMVREVVGGAVKGSYTYPLRDNSDDGWLRGVRRAVEDMQAAARGRGE